jgi:hypothetical protein
VQASFGGKDANNYPVKGTPEEYAIRVPAKDLIETRGFWDRARFLVGAFVKQVTEGAVLLPELPEDQALKVDASRSDIEVKETIHK